jgi:hypothetical protein
VRALLDVIRRAAGARAQSPLRLIVARPLQHGAALYVADVDDRRLVFATTAHAVTLLAAYTSPRAHCAAGPSSPGV